MPVQEPLFLRRPELCIGCGRRVRACAGLGAPSLQDLGGAGDELDDLF